MGNGDASLAGNNIAFVGLELYAYDRDPASPNFNPATVGNNVSGSGNALNLHFSWILIEDCKISFLAKTWVLTRAIGPGEFQPYHPSQCHRGCLHD